MTAYLTVHDLTVIFKKDERTIHRWIHEERHIVFDNKQYLPEKDPSGHWRFKIAMTNYDKP